MAVSMMAWIFKSSASRLGPINFWCLATSRANPERSLFAKMLWHVWNGVLSVANCDSWPYFQSSSGPVATPTRESDLRKRIRLDRAGLINNLELTIISNFPHKKRFANVVILGADLDFSFRRIELNITYAGSDFIDLKRPGFFYGTFPQVNLGIGRRHRIIGNTVLAVLVLEFLHELSVLGCIDRLKVGSGCQMPLQLCPVKATHFIFAHVSRHDRQLVRRDALFH